MEEDFKSHFFKAEVAKNYYKRWNNAILPASVREHYDTFRDLMPRYGYVLDAGCGTGKLEPVLLKYGFVVTGVDQSPQMLKLAKTTTDKCKFYKMSLDKLGFEDKSFDGVFCVGGVFMDIKISRLGGILSEFKRVLKRNGIVLIATRAAKKKKVTIEEATEGGKIIVNYYDKNTIEKVLTKAGFSVISYVEDPDPYSRPFNFMYVYAKVNL